MKKILLFFTSTLFGLLLFFFFSSPVQAVSVDEIFKPITPPAPVQGLGVGSAGISNVLSKIVQLIFVLGGIIFIFMVIISALQWIISGGDKEAIAKARGRLTWAIIGIVLLSLAFVITTTIGKITGFKF
ncbi:MAG: pilin [bacterium]|nr:pilin [bacterium]